MNNGVMSFAEVADAQARCCDELWKLFRTNAREKQENKGEIFMNSTVVAIPSSHPGGLESALGAHFGHCDLYTVVKIADGEVQEVLTLPNVPHQQGGCMAPVNHLAQNGVQVLIAGGMGMRPLMGFNQVGINVFYGGGVLTVGDAVNAFVNGRLQRFTTEFTCGGGGGAH
jgi:predicted Fe-Mo cluster-binding NifX family protein